MDSITKGKSKSIAVAILIVFLGMIGMTIGQLVTLVIPFSSDSLQFGSMIIISQVLGLGGVSFAVLKYKYNSLSIIQFDFEFKRDVPAIAGIVVLLVGLNFIVAGVTGLAGVEQAENSVKSALEMSDTNIYLFAIISLLFVGPLEEMFFRGTVQQHLKDTFTETHAVLITAGLFAAIHILSMVGTDPLGFVSYLVLLFIGGFGLGWAYEYTDNLAVPMVGHGVYNALLAISLLFV